MRQRPYGRFDDVLLLGVGPKLGNDSRVADHKNPVRDVK